MINTYQTSLAPPPVPPRHSGSHQVLIPAPLPSQGHSKALLHFLVGVVLLHLFLSIGGFIFLSYEFKPERSAPAEGKMSFFSSGKQIDLSSLKSYKALAHLEVNHKPETKSPTSGFLEWDSEHSDLRNISLYYKTRLTIQRTGKYYVYSKVTFSKADPSMVPLTSWVMVRKSERDKDEVQMKAYCHLESKSVPFMCTATQGELITLEKGNQIGVWVRNRSLVDYEEKATVFGIYEL
ncbi:CD40 ligand [Cheilinus undulatus]|uniref:CD40 ligand n=1 Tax=Cheilinus undulatus TaxID=241271 RepID=UPI001BD58853|nr:CD40 ligand [Cheilinus undulatus]